MYIRKLNIKNFGKFHEKELELYPGINLIYGGNEAGKTTIKDFVSGMLYGMKPEGTVGKTDAFRRYKPRSGKEYNGGMTIEQDDHIYEIERTFETEPQEFHVKNQTTGEVCDVPESGALPDDLTPSTKRAYMNTLCVNSRGAAYSVHLWEELGDQLSTKAASTETDSASAQKKEDASTKLQDIFHTFLDIFRLTEEQKRQMDPQLRQILGFIKVLFAFGLFAVITLLIYVLPISWHYKLWLIVMSVVILLLVWIRSLVHNFRVRRAKKDREKAEKRLFRKDHIVTEVSDKCSELMNKMTKGKYSDVSVDDRLHIRVRKDNRDLDKDTLNTATQEQLNLSVRLTAAEMLHLNQLPMIMDDCFGAYDDERLQETLRVLADYKAEQLLILSANRRIESILNDMELPYHKIVL